VKEITTEKNILTENSAGTLDSEVSDVIKAILNNDTATLATLANDMAKILNAVISK
jgi:dUTPase